MKLTQLAKIELGFFPTPLHKLEKLSAYLGGPTIYIKRDDQTGLATGGNKTRKLEYLVADALQKKCDVLITGGAAQSNHCRQTAAAAALTGLSCHLALGGFQPETTNGNLLLDKLLGATIHWEGKRRKGESMPEIAEMLKQNGKKPYIIPYGGSNAIGTCGYIFAVQELKKQMSELNLSFDSIVFASSSGGTHAGLTVGKALFDLPSAITGIRIDKGNKDEKPYPLQLAELSSEAAHLLYFDRTINEDDFDEREGYQGEGYGIVNEQDREAVKIMAKTEGILLDPVYTGRTMAGLLDLIRNDHYSSKDNILFWHTGGSAALFNYVEDLL